MLTKGDDYPLHQTPEPILYAGSDRRFYERYFFNGYSRELDLFFALGMGIYPGANLIDASFCVTHEGVQHKVHASRVLDFERLDTRVGPIRLEIVEPLETLRFRRGTRHATSAVLEMLCESDRRVEISLEFQPLQFYMMGLGHFHPDWGHGVYNGPAAAGYEAIELASVDESAFPFNHVEACCQARMRDSDGTVREGIGIMEQLIFGPHAPSGFREFLDVAG